MKPLITALVDTFNHELYIEQALSSVLEQGLSASELEIVVVDDGSTDKTPSIIRKFQPRAKYLRKKNGGQASAFNVAFPEANGQIVAILDGDDWWAKGKLPTVLEEFERNPETSAVGHAYWKFYEKNNQTQLCGPQEAIGLNLATPEAARAAFRGWAFLQPSALTVRRHVLERVMPIPEVLVISADSPITFASMALGVRILPEPLSYYRLHGSNLYANEEGDAAKLRRRYEADDIVFGVISPMLLRLGVSPECVSAFIDPVWTAAKRANLSAFGGSRLMTFRTEMRAFRSEFRNPSIAYRLFKYVVVGIASLVLSPRAFYRGRDWYARRKLGALRDKIIAAETTGPRVVSDRPSE